YRQARQPAGLDGRERLPGARRRAAPARAGPPGASRARPAPGRRARRAGPHVAPPHGAAPEHHDDREGNRMITHRRPVPSSTAPRARFALSLAAALLALAATPKAPDAQTVRTLRWAAI